MLRNCNTTASRWIDAWLVEESSCVQPFVNAAAAVSTLAMILVIAARATQFEGQVRVMWLRQRALRAHEARRPGHSCCRLLPRGAIELAPLHAEVRSGSAAVSRRPATRP